MRRKLYLCSLLAACLLIGYHGDTPRLARLDWR